jgi:hypothetical protein
MSRGVGESLNRSIKDLVRLHVEADVKGTERGELANDILQLLFDEKSLDVLEPLFSSASGDCARTLTFLLTEVGLRSIEAMPWLDSLLEHPDEWVRHHAVVAIQHSGTLAHPRVSARAVEKVRDARAVRFAAVRFVANGSILQLGSAVEFLSGPLVDVIDSMLNGDYRDFERWFTFEVEPEVGYVAVGALQRGVRNGVLPGVDRLLFQGRTELIELADWVDRLPLPVMGRDVLHRLGKTSEGSGSE